MSLSMSLCCIFQAFKRGHTYSRYAWIAYDWYPPKWWSSEISDVIVNCSDSEIAKFLQVISFRRYPVPDDVNAATDSGVVSH